MKLNPIQILEVQRKLSDLAGAINDYFIIDLKDLKEDEFKH